MYEGSAKEERTTFILTGYSLNKIIIGTLHLYEAGSTASTATKADSFEFRVLLPVEARIAKFPPHGQAKGLVSGG